MSDDLSTAFRDVLFLTLLGFVSVIIILLAHIQPPPTPTQEEITRGSIRIEVRWPDDLDVDVDVWARAPGDSAVGYSAKNATILDLRRDDLGVTNDLLGLNYETIESRGAPPGEYVVNLHLYNLKQAELPVPVVVRTTIKNGHTIRVIDERAVQLRREGEELTVVRFSLDDDQRVVPGSVHDTPHPLRSR